MFITYYNSRWYLELIPIDKVTVLLDSWMVFKFEKSYTCDQFDAVLYCSEQNKAKNKLFINMMKRD